MATPISPATRDRKRSSNFGTISACDVRVATRSTDPGEEKKWEVPVQVQKSRAHIQTVALADYRLGHEYSRLHNPVTSYVEVAMAVMIRWTHPVPPKTRGIDVPPPRGDVIAPCLPPPPCTQSNTSELPPSPPLDIVPPLPPVVIQLSSPSVDIVVP